MVFNQKEYLKEYFNCPETKKKHLAYMKAYFSTPEGKQKRLEAVKRWKIKHRTKYLIQQKAYAKKSYKKLFPRYKKIRLKSRIELRKQVIEHYGNKCACCGETIYQFLTIDHINNDGNIHRKEIGTGSANIIHNIIKRNYPDDIQVLCWNCNKGKYFNKGICPHKLLK